MDLGRVSVCVPAYNRPAMLKQLVHSFLKQDYPNKELVISDDSSNDQVESMVSSFTEPRILYIRNHQNLGFAKNSYQALSQARGEYILLMGDDDLFLSPRALSKYAEIFTSHLSVSYVNCNNAQFSSALEIENIYTTFLHDTLFDAGADSMQGIWTTSIPMSGIGLRNTFELDQFYPQENLLFPQLEYVGHVINQADSYGIAAELIGIRAHPDQLGFYAIRGERIKNTERHGTIELFAIYDRLASRYRFQGNADYLAKDLIERYKTSMLKEKLIVGNTLVRLNYKHFCAVSLLARQSKTLRASYWMSQVFPAWAIRVLRALFLFQARWRNHQSFGRLQNDLASMSSSSERDSIRDVH
ncbi:MAG TPA: glycosyltransferase family 2 protein [Candidatus Dormibacteraeota bacterium]|nr:glycosyltransferase family 2 protein [Candidatus Dormibacteraeota bacterium]